MELPTSLESRAFRSRSGEYAWRPDDIADVVSFLVRHRRAVLGGELWLVRGADIRPAITDSSGQVVVHSWVTGERGSGETWDAFVARCAEHSLSAAASIAADPGIVAAAGDRTPYCNIAWADEGEYERLGAGTSGS